MSRPRTVSKPSASKAQIQVYTKQQFNYKRNNSVLMSTCLSWFDQHEIEDQDPAKNRVVSFPEDDHEEREGRDVQTLVEEKKINENTLPSKQRATSAVTKKDRKKSTIKKDFSKYEKTPEQLMEEERKAEERKDKIKDYIQQMVPFSRNFTDSRFQHLYQKSAPYTYGSASTNQPAGGVLYGNNFRSFNVNPHDFQNNPKKYQSHTTALNFATRCKRDDSKHWKRLQKQLGKKLNLYQKNPTLIEGKQVVYVDVNDVNMYEIMRENLQFKKEHGDEIKKDQKNYQNQKELKFQAQKEKFYRNKAQKTQQNLQRTMAYKFHNDRDPEERIGEQVIYKHHDKDGNVRVGADRHSLTCFVDTNFPENDKIYTEELKKRNQIFPTEVEDRHKNLAEKKRENFEKSLSNVYPSHYLLPCTEQPQIQKMVIQRSRDLSSQRTKRRY